MTNEYPKKEVECHAYDCVYNDGKFSCRYINKLILSRTRKPNDNTPRCLMYRKKEQTTWDDGT